MSIEWYEHHDQKVAVRSDLKGRHWEHCLCARCSHFAPDNQSENCTRARLLYHFCVAFDMVTPVWECPDFEDSSVTETEN